MSNLIKTAKARSEANEAYEKAFRSELRSLRPMDTEEFWETLPFLAENVETDRSVDSAMHNFMCNVVYQSYGEHPACFGELSEYNRWELACRFHNKYEEIVSTLSKKCWEMKGLERGDDGYGDLMDSLPLAGREVVDGIMNDDIANYKQLQKALAAHPKRGEYILNGENYIASSLERALQKALLSVVRRDERDEEYERDPDPHAVLVTRPMPRKYNHDPVCGIETLVRGPFRDSYEAEAFAKQEGGVAVKLVGGVVKR